MKFWLKIALQVSAAIAVSTASAGSYEDFFKAVELDRPAMVRDLLQRGFDPNTPNPKGQVALYLALRGESFAVAEALHQHPDLKVDLANPQGETPLMMAALRGQLSWVVRMLDKGARIDGTTEPGQPGWTPLHYAAASPGAKALLVVLSRGARIDARSPNGTTPLMMAAMYSSSDMVKLLLESGAEAYPRNDLDLSAEDFAVKAGRVDSVRLIRQVLQR